MESVSSIAYVTPRSVTQPKDEATFGATFEEYAGLERARSDHWEGKSPWLTGDTTPQMKAVASLLPRLRPKLADDATDEDFEKTRLAFRSWEKTRRCTELLEKLHGPNVFGLRMFTQSPIDVSPSKTDATVFMGLLAFYLQQPWLIDNMISAGETLDSALDVLRQQLENATRKTAEN
ncbi:MAG: hypothetical protein WB526_01165 [Candidatus Cybelea sp.]